MRSQRRRAAETCTLANLVAAALVTLCRTRSSTLRRLHHTPPKGDSAVGGMRVIKREVYTVINKNLPSEPQEWFGEINRKIWDFIYMWIRDEDDVVGAQQVAVLLQNFYKQFVSVYDVLGAWKYRRKLGYSPTISPMHIVFRFFRTRSSRTPPKGSPTD